jgi:hypothetical protein
VKSKVGEFIHGMSRVTSVLDNTQVDPFSAEALERKLHSVTAGVSTSVFSSAWSALDRDAAITNRRIATPSKDPRLEMLLRNPRRVTQLHSVSDCHEGGPQRQPSWPKQRRSSDANAHRTAGFLAGASAGRAPSPADASAPVDGHDGLGR